MKSFISFIQNNGKWLVDLSINICMIIGYLGFILVTSWQIRFRERENKPQIDVQVEINDRNQLRLELHNSGELDTEGVIYLLVEPLANREADFFDSEIIPNRDYQPLADREKFNKYCFGKLEFKLGKQEEPHSYEPCPLFSYLRELTGKEQITHIIRIEGSYQSVKYNDRTFIFTKNYKLTPRDDGWVKSRVSFNAKFFPVDQETALVDFEEYKQDLDD